MEEVGGGGVQGVEGDRVEGIARRSGTVLGCAVLASGAELSHSEHSFGPRLIAVQAFISRAMEAGPIFSSICGTGTENRSLFLVLVYSVMFGAI